MKYQHGFTLLELVIALVVAGIVAGFVATFIGQPLEAYQSLSRRAELVDANDNALRAMARDIRRAVPNSVRISSSGNRVALEMLNTIDGGRYVDTSIQPANLSFGIQDAQFRYNGLLTNSTALSAGQMVIVNNLSATGVSNNAYKRHSDAPVNINNWASLLAVDDAAACDTSLNEPDDRCIEINPAPAGFTNSSAEQRFFISDGPITYLCDTGSGTLTRYRGYGAVLSQPTNPGNAPLSNAQTALLATQVVGCQFNYAPGSSQNMALVTIELSLAHPNATHETVHLVHQIHVDNDA